MAYLALVERHPWAGSADFLKERTYLGNQHVSMSLPIVIHRAKKELTDVITMGAPIWHIMKIFSTYGVNEFVTYLGYKGYIITEYFANYLLHSSNVTFHMASNQAEKHDNQTKPWKVTLIYTGGRLHRAKE